MIFSDAFPITFKGQPAQLRVVRNDGFCWGRLVLKSGEELDIETGRDQYERADEDAAVAFENAAKRGNVEPAVGEYRIGWADQTEEVMKSKPKEQRDVGVSATFMVSKQFLSDILAGMAETCPEMVGWFGDDKTVIERIAEGEDWLSPLSVIRITGRYDRKEHDEGTRLGKATLDFAAVQLALTRLCTYKALDDSIRGRIMLGLMDNDCGHIDSEAADVLAQLAIFGEVVYG
jgi:hypothetical protein